MRDAESLCPNASILLFCASVDSVNERPIVVLSTAVHYVWCNSTFKVGFKNIPETEKKKSNRINDPNSIVNEIEVLIQK